MIGPFLAARISTVVRRIAEGFLMAVLLCHMAAVAVYALPAAAGDPVTRFMRERLGPVVTPYVQLTGQWQQWDMFSPDPLTRVTFYSVETLDQAGQWRGAGVIHPDSVAFWRRGPMFKMLLTVLEQPDSPLAARLTKHLCASYGVPAGSALRVSLLSGLLPRTEDLPEDGWSTWNLGLQNTGSVETVCSSPAEAVPLRLP